MRARSCDSPGAVEASGVVVAVVRAGTPAAAAGLVAGDHILAINGHPLRDAIDFQFHAGDERLVLEVLRDGGALALALRRRGAELGLELVAPRAAEIATCANKCVFCFIHQLPKGMRRSLYVKDDDFRLSFLHGNYITLTDLDEADLARIVEQRLSPLYVSVHATDPALRRRLLGEPRRSAEILPRMERLAKAGIRMHAQIVLCPDWNDGPHLARTVGELAPLHPAVATTAVVPVGLTRHRERLPSLRGLRPDEARGLVDTVGGWQERFRAELGSRFVFLADEIHLLAGAYAQIYFTSAHANDLSHWSNPAAIAPANGDRFGGEMSIAPNGRIDVSFYDRSYSGNRLVDLSYAGSKDGGSTWSTQRVTPAGFDPRRRIP